jgi:hypothetical protein
VEVGVVLGRGGGGIGVCCARDEVRVKGPKAAPATAAVPHGKFVLFVAGVTVGVTRSSRLNQLHFFIRQIVCEGPLVHQNATNIGHDLLACEEISTRLPY